MFRQFVNTDETEPGVEFVVERGQKRPAGWPSDIVQLQPPKSTQSAHLAPRDVDGRRLAERDDRNEHLLAERDEYAGNWHRVGHVSDFPKDAGACVKVEGRQIAVYRFASRGEWYACQNLCPHKREMVLSRGLLGDSKGVPKVACPVHKKAFSLESGECLTGEDYSVEVYRVKVESDDVFVLVPALTLPVNVLPDTHRFGCGTSPACANAPAPGELSCFAS
jgi:nitrite reductase (NADH) large subunit